MTKANHVIMKYENFMCTPVVPVADTDFVAKSPTQAFSLVLANTPPRWSGTMRWISWYFWVSLWV